MVAVVVRANLHLTRVTGKVMGAMAVVAATGMMIKVFFVRALHDSQLVSLLAVERHRP